MRIPLAFVADEANVSQEGKLNVMGIFDRIAAGEFPVIHPKMVFAFRVESEFGDAGRVYPVTVRLLDDDDLVLFEADGQIAPPTIEVGAFATANQVFSLVGVHFPHEGRYRFVVTIAGMEAHETHFLVQSPARDPSMN
jgi:hypothetical protein